MKRRPYVFELLLLPNLAWVFWTARGSAVATLRESFVDAGGVVVAAAIVGVVIRLLVAWRRGHTRRLVRIISSRPWLTDTLRIFIGMSLLTETYGWIKLLVPIVHRRLFDRQLFDLDQKLFFGMSPSIFFLQLFSQPAFLHFIDAAYAYFFIGGMVIAFAFFFSIPGRRVRMTFMTSSTVMWLVGAWLYVLIPSLGPAYRFPDIWFAYSADLARTQATQVLLMRNYNAVIRTAAGGEGKVLLAFGIAAFPSLHVATQTLIAIWMGKAWRPGAAIFAAAAFFVFIGSMITGWHYLIDGIAGAALAFGSYAAARWIAKKEFHPARARF
jgi:hypothetical protein